MTKAALVKAVREHAAKNYDKGGWDYVVECYDDDDIIELIGDATDAWLAIKRVGEVMAAKDDYRRDIQAEAF